MNNRQKAYWESRISQVYDQNHNMADIKKLYKKSFYEIEAEIKEVYGELLEKGSLSTTKLYKMDRFFSLRKQIQKQSGNIRSGLTGDVRKKLTNAYKDTFNVVQKQLGRQSEWGVQNQKLLNASLRKNWEGANFSKRIWKNTNKLSKEIESHVVNCVITGRNKDEAIKDIMHIFDVDFSKTDRLVRTELMHTINEGQRDTYKQENIERVQIYATDDERTCDECCELHEKIYEIDTAPILPIHCNCRCCYLPVI